MREGNPCQDKQLKQTTFAALTIALLQTFTRIFINFVQLLIQIIRRCLKKIIQLVQNNALSQGHPSLHPRLVLCFALVLVQIRKITKERFGIE